MTFCQIFSWNKMRYNKDFAHANCTKSAVSKIRNVISTKIKFNKHEKN